VLGRVLTAAGVFFTTLVATHDSKLVFYKYLDLFNLIFGTVSTQDVYNDTVGDLGAPIGRGRVWMGQICLVSFGLTYLNKIYRCADSVGELV
jgi:hypothetical protein